MDSGDRIGANRPKEVRQHSEEDCMTSGRVTTLRYRVLTNGLFAASFMSLIVANAPTTNAADINTPAKTSKRTIGATATLSEASTGLSFPARIDTGAETCSLHVEKVEIA